MAPGSTPKRLGIISDIHADFEALQNAIVQAKRLGCALVMCAGDVVGYGYFPMETIALLRQHEIPCVRGNHDRWAVDPAMAGSTSGLLTQDGLAYLSSLPRVWHGRFAGVRVTICHGTPRSDMDGIVPGVATPLDVGRWLAEAEADVLIVGHTHTAAAIFHGGGGMIVNPGTLMRQADASAPPLVYDPKKSVWVEPQTTPHGTFGVLELPSRRFTVHLASNGEEVAFPSVTVGVTNHRR